MEAHGDSDLIKADLEGQVQVQVRFWSPARQTRSPSLLPRGTRSKEMPPPLKSAESRAEGARMPTRSAGAPAKRKHQNLRGSQRSILRQRGPRSG